VRIRARFSATLVAGLVCLATGVVWDNPIFFFTGMALWSTFVPSLLDILLKRQILAAAKGGRELEKTSFFAGEPLEARVSVESKSYPLDVIELSDPHSEMLKPADGGRIFFTPHGRDLVAYTLRCARRGRCTLGPLELIAFDRFNHFSDEVRLAGEEKITVYPPYEDVRKLELSGKTRELGKLFGVHRTRQVGIGAEFYGIRGYLPTDEYRRIAWKHFARHVKLMSKEFEGEKNITVMLCLDASDGMRIGAEPATKLEYAIRASVVMAKVAGERGDSFGFAAFSDSIKKYLPPGRGRKHFYQLLEALVDVEAGGVAWFEEFADYLNSVLRRVTLLILLTDLEGDFDDLKRSIQKLQARGHKVLIICPFTPRFEIGPIGDPVLDVVASALLEKFEVEHKHVREELGKLGVECVEVGPREFLPVALHKFLEKKKLGVALI